MPVHFDLLATIWRSWREVVCWGRPADALFVCAAFLPIAAVMALHMPSPASAYLLWLLAVTAVAGFVALWSILCAAAATLEKRQLSSAIGAPHA